MGDGLNFSRAVNAPRFNQHLTPRTDASDPLFTELQDWCLFFRDVNVT